MGQTVTLGGDRLGSGNKQKVELHNYQMTSFNLSQDFKSTMAPGVLYPFLRMVATNHGTFDIDLDSFVRTLPTKGPLFGSYKLQADIFAVPFRLYQGILHNNPIKVGLNMDKIYLPKLLLEFTDGTGRPEVVGANEDNWQINESALLKYGGMSGVGRGQGATTNVTVAAKRKIQCLPELAYYDIFKNYYANKQEENAYVITPGEPSEENGIKRVIQGNVTEDWNQIIKDYKNYNGQTLIIKENEPLTQIFQIFVTKTKGFTTQDYITGIDIEGTEFSTDLITLQNYGVSDIETYETNDRITISFQITDYQTFANYMSSGAQTTPDNIEIIFNAEWNTNMYAADIALTPFKLDNIDDMRNALLSSNTIGKEFVLGLGETDWNDESGSDETGLPYSALFKKTENGINWNAFTMNGLVVKTYQSDLFNNWLDTEYIDGNNGISAISSVSVVNNKFSMDSLNLAEKIYEYLNRVLVAGGTYEDWQEATYGEGAVRKAETPMYVGGMSSEIMFEEVIATTDNQSGDQKLGELGGRGTQTGKNGGNNIHIKCDEPSYIIGIVSITPRICYCQGNDWDRTELDTMDDLHKPALDGIGFQNLMVEQMAWWDTVVATDGRILQRHSAGKQIAWQNYQTAIDKCFGDFAKKDGYGFMVLSRHYEHGNTFSKVKDVTTYIDPAKYNYVFAYNKLDAQNFWVQIHSYVTARRKMAGKQIPNL